MKKILITGLTGSGKTTLARALAPILGAVVFDGDDIRKSYPVPIGFSVAERALHANHMGTLCDAVTASGNFAIASFVCPTEHTRAQFAPDFTIFCLDRGDQKFNDTMALWRDPVAPDLRVDKTRSPMYWAGVASKMLLRRFVHKIEDWTP